MPIDITSKLAALLNGITQADIEALRPARRERLGQLLKHWGARCDPSHGQPKGVLVKLEKGEGAP